MFFVITETTVPAGKNNIRGEFYKTLLGRVKKVPGFLEDVPFGSPIDKEKGALVARFTDEEAVIAWRQDRTHLSIQQKSRESIFTDYRIRVGFVLPEGNRMSGSRHPDSTESLTSKAGQFMVLYTHPMETKAVNAEKITDFLETDPESKLLMRLIEYRLYQSDTVRLWMTAWQCEADAIEFEDSILRRDDDEVYRIQVVRDYGMFDRTEAPSNHNHDDPS
jgi:heme-degrading monooxygenase HmoA